MKTGPAKMDNDNSSPGARQNVSSTRSGLSYSLVTSSAPHRVLCRFGRLPVSVRGGQASPRKAPAASHVGGVATTALRVWRKSTFS